MPIIRSLWKIANSKYVAAPLGFVSASQKTETVGAVASASYPASVIDQLKPVEQQSPSSAEPRPSYKLSHPSRRSLLPSLGHSFKLKPVEQHPPPSTKPGQSIKLKTVEQQPPLPSQPCSSFRLKSVELLPLPPPPPSEPPPLFKLIVCSCTSSSRGKVGWGLHIFLNYEIEWLIVYSRMVLINLKQSKTVVSLVFSMTVPSLSTCFKF